MSISTLQEKFFNKGCGSVIIGAAALAMVISMFARNAGSSSSNGDTREGAPRAIATVGGLPLSAEAIQTKATELEGQEMQRQAARLKLSPDAIGAPGAAVQAQALVAATGDAVQRAGIQALASQEAFTDEEITAVAAQAVDAGLKGVRDQLVQMGRLKPTATDAEFEAAVKDQLKGKTIAQLRAEAPKEALDAYKDPTKKPLVLAQYGGPLLVRRVGEKIVGDEQALRNSYKSYVVRRIFLSSTSGSSESPDARAAKALADVKGGKGFDAVMDAVSNDPAPKGKKVHDATEIVPAESMATRSELAALVGAAPNTTTHVVDVPGGKAIYQLVAIKDELPKDFDKNKVAIRAERVKTIGSAEVEKRLKAFVSGSAVKWQSKGYQALGAAAEADPMAMLSDPAVGKKAVDAAQAAIKSEDATDRRLGALAFLAVTDKSISFGTKSPEATANRLAALSAVLANGIEDAAISLELAGLYGDAKDGAKATDALIAASKSNSRYDAEGERTFRDIAGKALALESTKVLTKAQLESVQAQQALWTAGRADNEKNAVKAKSDAQREKAENDAEIARQKAQEATANGPKSGSAAADKAANDDEIARQKAEAATSKKAPSAPKGGSLLPTGPGR